MAPVPDPALDRVGVRDLRRQLATLLRRADAGERIVVTVAGRPVAQLGPVTSPGAPTLDDLVAAGLVLPPGRPDRPLEPGPVPVPVDVRLDTALDELRGGGGR